MDKKDFYLVWHFAVKGNNAVDVVYASSPDEADTLTNYDGTYDIELWNANERSRDLFSELTKKGIRALKKREVIRLEE